MDLKYFADVATLVKLSQPDQILHLAWYLHVHAEQSRIDPSSIRGCYELLHMEVPNLSKNFTRLCERRPKVWLKDANGFFLENRVRQRLDERYGQHETTIAVSGLLRELPGKVSDQAERIFLSEAITCYHNRAFRAAIIMSWNLTYDHMARWILADAERLRAFNLQIGPRLGVNSKRSNTSISKREDFEKLEEKEMIDIMSNASLLPSSNTKKILEMQLTRRNMVAHPSLIAVDAPQADDTISSLVLNVLLVLQ